MADASSPAYVLRTPVAERGESITSQLQREILGDAAAPAPASESAANERDALPTTTPLDEPTVLTAPTTPTPRTPRATDDADLVAMSTPEALPQQQPTQPETTATTATRDDRRRTLSPSKALAFFNQVDDDDEVVTTASRRDTVSPESIRSLLRGLNDADGASRRASVAAGMGLDPTTNLVDDAMLNETRQDVERTKQYLETSKLAMRQSSPPSSKRRRTSGSTGRSATTDQDSFTDAFFSTNLLSHDEGGDNGNEDNTIESVDGRPINRRSTLEPTDAQAMLSEIQAEMVGTIAEEEKEEKAPTPHMATRRTTRQSTSPSPSPNTRSRKRRSTIDPTDLLAIHNGPSPGPVAATIDANRRDTIGDGELLVLQREFGLEATSTTESSRKRKAKTPSPARPTEGAAKRTRSNAMNAREIENEENPRRSTITPQKKQTMANADSLFSPPPTNRAKTPLKSCLSARKAKPKDDTTPNKSVNFGPPQATHFNRGSPSTSMTPMPEKDAVARFLLEPPPTEEEDAETAQNSSLLEEVDGQGSSDDEPVAAAAAPPLVQRPQSIEPVVSARTRRRYSLRGVSPLDNQANARRQRRQSAMASSTPHQQSPLVSARNRRAFEAAATAAALAASRTASPARTSFMSVTDPTPQSRAAFADSSASSDEGEDMEITGDYTNHAATAATLQTGVRQSRLSESPRRSARVSARQDSLFPDSPLSDGTVEVTSLGDLVAEDYREEEKRQRSQQLNQSEVDDDDDDDVPSLALLAREGEDDEDQPQRNNFADRQAKNLQPITEGDDEDRRSSSAHSRMSLDSDEESDAEYDKKRKSLVVNLSSKFERSGSPKARKPSEQRTEVSSSLQRRLSLMASPGKRASPSRAVPSPSPQKLPDPLRIEEVFARVHFEEISREVVERVDASVLETDVQRSCVAHAALSSLRYSTKDVDSWCKGLAESIPSLAREKVSRVFSTDDPGALAQLDESIKSLQTIENVHVRSGYCQWRSKLEKTICDGLAQCENKLQSDVKTLRSMLDNDRSYRESELRAVKELMERERQMEQLLDGIEEQQAVQREYASSVQQLESGCSSLSLEASVLDQQLAAIEQSSPQSDMSEATESKLRRNVLELEELLAVRESVGMWRVLSATDSKLAIASRYEDVFFSIEVRVAIDTAGPGQRASFTVTPVFTTKTRRHKVDDESRFENDEDALSTIASVIVSKRQVERYESKTLDVAQLSSGLGELSTTLRRAYQYLSDLRSISTQFGMRLEAVDDNNCNMWIDFVRFPHVVPSGVVVDGVKFSVGHRLHFSWPYTDFDWHVQIAYGTLTEEKLRQQLNEVPRRSGHDYLTRVCQRLRDIFIQDS